jgi:NAD(P)H-flavin reductase
VATIHLKEVIEYLSKKEGANSKNDEFFFELLFSDPDGKKTGVIDEEYKNDVITVDCPYGTVTILFDEEGQLKSLEIC